MIDTDSTTYEFVYDNFGNTDSVSVGNTTLADYVYDDYNGKLHTIHYGNGISVNYVYDELENIKEAWYTDDKGMPIGMQYRKTTCAANDFDTYWFEKNLQGDIVAVHSEDGRS